MKVKIGKFLKTNEGRKVNVEIEDFDTYSLDHTLALIILPCLLQLKETKHGVPGEFGDVGGADYEYQDSFDFYKETHNWAFQEQCKEWDKILDKMIWSFQQLALADPEEKYHHGKTEYDWIKSDKQYLNPITGKLEDTFQMVDKNPGEHWYDGVGHKLHYERIQEGLDLFAKYYMSLWD